MNFLRDLFGKKEKKTVLSSSGPIRDIQQAVPVANSFANDYAQMHPPVRDTMQNFLQILKLWMDTASPVSDRNKLSTFMDGYARDWHVACGSGITLEPPIFGWKPDGVAGSVLQLGVYGAYHVIGKASNNEFLYLAHQ